MRLYRITVVCGMLSVASLLRAETISGRLLDEAGQGIGGTAVSAGSAGTAVSRADGSYRLRVPQGWTGKLRPQHAKFTFEPTERSFSQIRTDLSGQDFLGRHAPVKVAGIVTRKDHRPLAGVSITARDPASDKTLGSVRTDTDGRYELLLTYHASLELKPGLQHYAFEPTSVMLNSIAEATEQSFTASANSAQPAAKSFSVTTDEDTPVAATLSGNDPDASALQFRITQPPAHGSLDVPATQPTAAMAITIRYSPAADYNGSDSFSYVANDGTQDSEPATVNIAVAPVNDAPRGQEQQFTLNIARVGEIQLAAADPEGDAIEYRIVQAPRKGRLEGSGPLYSYMPDPQTLDASPAGTIFVDNGLWSSSTTSYSPASRSARGGSFRAYRSLQDAAREARAGDTVILREGQYTEPLIPANSGEPGRPIVFQATRDEDTFTYIAADDKHAESHPVQVKLHLREDAVITNAALDPAIDISGKHHITLRGLQVDGVRRWLYAVNTHDCNIEGCRFSRALHPGSSKSGLYFENATFNRIENNDLTDVTQDIVSLIQSDRNVLQNNRITHAGHALWAIKCGSFNIIRGNYLHNDLQKIGELFDCHDTGFDHDLFRYNATQYNLVERNIFALTPSSGNSSPYAGIQYAAQHGIIRRNLFVDTVGPGLSLTFYPHEATYDVGNRVYHNTFTRTHYAGLSLTAGRTESFTDNVIKNNIFAGSRFTANDTRWPRFVQELDGKPIQIIAQSLSGYTLQSNCIYGDAAHTEYFVTIGERNSIRGRSAETVAVLESHSPEVFADNLVADPLLGTADNQYRPALASPVVDRGAFLTVCTSAGEGTSMPVADAGYFFDGFGIAGEKGDLIQLEGDASVARVVAVDYASNTLQLSQMLQWSKGQGVALQYTGVRPDIGMHELPAAQNAAPVTLSDARAVSGNGLTWEVSAEGSFAPDGTITLYKCDWGDGTVEESPSPSLRHTYARPSTYDARLRAVDSQGREGAPATCNIRAGQPALQIAPAECLLTQRNRQCELKITNSGEGTLAYRIESLPKWLSASTSAGIVTTQPASVSLTANAGAMKPGDYEAQVLVDGQDAGRAQAAVRLHVPELVREPLVRAADEWKYFKGISEPPAAWNQPGFDDSSWPSGAGGLGFSEDMKFATVLSDMRGRYVTVYLRRRFAVTDANRFHTLQLSVVYKDAFIAYLNGSAVTRSGSMGSPAIPVTYRTAAPAKHKLDRPEEVFTIDGRLLKEGENVLTIELHVVSTSSTSAGIVPSLWGLRTAQASD